MRTLRTEEELEELLASISTVQEEPEHQNDNNASSDTVAKNSQADTVHVERRTAAIKRTRAGAKEALTQQAAKMLKLSEERYRDAEVGETVRIPILMWIKLGQISEIS